MSSDTFGPRYVFVDESGDPSLAVQKQGVSDYFVLTAVLVDGSRLREVEDASSRMIRRHVPSGELHSRTVGSNVSRRLRILRDLASLDVRHYSQVIDKSAVFSDSGLRFKKTFLKFIHRTVYQNLARAFSDLHVIADEHGRTEFMLEFARYLQERLPRRLFETSSFKFGDSKHYPLVQVADMICGSVARAYAGKDPITTLEPLRSITILIDEWPPRAPEARTDELARAGSRHDFLVRTQAIRAADSFVEERSDNPDPGVQAELAVVRFLLYEFRTGDPEQYVPTGRIHHHLRQQGFPMSDRVCRQVIGRLRDQGVFIASSARGIKIPFSVQDLRDFVRQVDTKVTPYLHRLQITRDHFLLASEGELDIVDDNEHPTLHGLLAKSPQRPDAQ